LDTTLIIINNPGKNKQEEGEMRSIEEYLNHFTSQIRDKRNREKFFNII